MTFFLESKRNTDFPVKDTPSPFQYQVKGEKGISKGLAPFGSTSRLNRSTKITKQKEDKNGKMDILDDEKVFTIEDKAIQMYAQQKMHSMFKSRSERFMSTTQQAPGPGAYELRSKYKSVQKKKEAASFHVSGLQKSRKANPPSIPTDSLGYKCDRNNNIEKVEPKKANPPVPGSYDLRKQLFKENGLTWDTTQTISRKEEDQTIPGPGHYNPKAKSDKKITSSFKSGFDRFNPKKIRKNYQPGPGDYHPKQVQPVRQFSQSHFNSKSMRFAPSKMSNVGPGSYMDSRTKSMKQFKQNPTLGNFQESEPLNMQPQRKTIFSLQNKNPGPGEYIARDGMTFELQKALLRKHNMSQFPNQTREVFVPRDEFEPGPGAYNPEKPHGMEKGNLGYKKAEVINLREDEVIQTPSPFNYNCTQHTMYKKIEDESKRITLTDAKPFNAGTQRFPHYSDKKSQNLANNLMKTDRNGTYESDSQSIDNGNKNMKFSDMKKTKKLIMTSVKVKVPFGSSASKFTDQEQLDLEVGPGFYEPGSNWLKHTYSIKGKINGK